MSTTTIGPSRDLNKTLSRPSEKSTLFRYFAFFFVSGFCGILYELVWLRLVMAQFGVTTALVSIVLSAFMAGLGTGSLGSGWLIRRYGDRISFPSLRLYALTELLIACSALAVPFELAAGHHLLAHIAGSTTFSSGLYYVISGVWVALTVVPWCACMGATIPLGMFAIRRDPRIETERSFSFLYLSNVLGAALGCALPLLFIELRGFHSTLQIGALLNSAIAVCAFLLTLSKKNHSTAPSSTQAFTASQAGKYRLVLLLMTGFATMGMEVVWIRMLTPYIGVMVYSFAVILLTYLLATFVGSATYRDSKQHLRQESPILWASLILLCVLPVLSCDPRLPLHLLLRVLLGIAPFATAAGYLTPKLVDQWSGGDPDRAALAYAVNVLGCILGPLVAGFVLLPRISESVTLSLFALPWIFVCSKQVLRQSGRSRQRAMVAPAVFCVLTATLFLSSRSFESTFPKRQVLRDSTATVVATGEGMQKRLLTNGVGMTVLTPMTKVMAHLPLAFLNREPRNTLVICFGMGTTYRSLISWGISSTAVELVPSVPKLFGYYHRDGPELLRSPLSHIVIDDGRRYLERTSEQYDVITIDPPPPVEAAGSSLLYSKHFYTEAKKHLRSGGILQQWLPWGDSVVRSSVAKAIQQSFVYVRVFHSVTGHGYHLLASDAPFPDRNSQELALRLPASAARDFVEWGPAATAEGQFQILLKNEIPVESMTAAAPDASVLEDDRPTNEYFAWRALHPDRSTKVQLTGNDSAP